MSIKEEVLKEIADLHSMDFIEIVLDVPRAIDLTQQKMIKEVEKVLKKKWSFFKDDLPYFEKGDILIRKEDINLFLEELKSQVEKGEKLCQ